jgi:hypothetical protein
MLCSLFFGTGGIVDYIQLQNYQKVLGENIEELQKIHQNLAIDLRDLSSNPDTIRQKARALGYYEEGEQVLRIEGLKMHRETKSIGSILRRNVVSSGQNPVFHIIGLSIALLTFVFFTFLHKRKAI